MTLARLLLKLWKLRTWVGVGVGLAFVLALTSLTVFHSAVYASASTEMVVDSPQSALGNAGIDLTGYIARATVFAPMMTSSQALQYIGRSAGIPGNQIAATGPTADDGSQPSTSTPTPGHGASQYKLNFLQNPELPTIEVFAQAPTTAKAVALANGAVAGFATYVSQLDGNYAIPAYNRIEIRQLGGATGGIVDPGASKSIAALIFLGVLALWCTALLYVTSMRQHLRTAQNEDGNALPALGEPNTAVHLADALERELVHSDRSVLHDDDEHLSVRLKR